METGGFKGRTRVVERDELYASLSETLGIVQNAIVAEYGMTELLSQYYDLHESRASGVRVKVAPPWLRPLVVDSEGREVAHGYWSASYATSISPTARQYLPSIPKTAVTAAATASSCSAAKRRAPARGCSLDAEDLIAR